MPFVIAMELVVVAPGQKTPVFSSVKFGIIDWVITDPIRESLSKGIATEEVMFFAMLAAENTDYMKLHNDELEP
jgi:hypothetical protein